MPADNHFHGEPYPLNTRVALKRVLAEAAEMGFAMNLGIECEIYVLKLVDGPARRARCRPTRSTKPCYDVRGLLRSFPFLDRMVTLMNGLGWDVYSFDHEDGNGQFEFDFNYADALTMADRYVFWRYMVKHVAEEFGLIATFMPKPFARQDRQRRALQHEPRRPAAAARTSSRPRAARTRAASASRTLGYHYIGGLLRHGRALCAVLAPTVNSYKRLIRRGAMSYYSWAPVFNSFGTNNRSNSIRVPMGGGRCEYRNADSSLNPYLAATLCLAAGSGRHPRAARSRRAACREPLRVLATRSSPPIGVQPLPRTLGEAVEAFAADPFVERVLGARAARRVHPLQARRVGGVPPARQRLGDPALRAVLLNTRRPPTPGREGGLRAHETSTDGLLALGIWRCCRWAAAPAEPLKVGYSDWPGFTAWEIAKVKGLFKKNGVDVDLVWFPIYTDSLTALNTGQLDCNLQTWNDAMAPLAEGIPLKAVRPARQLVRQRRDGGQARDRVAEGSEGQDDRHRARHLRSFPDAQGAGRRRA